VTLRLDTSRALRTHHSQVELVKAIVGAPESTQETQAVEWKSEVNLREKVWRARLAKGILGFANRDPAIVTQWFEGCAYLVIGACPGKLVGTTVLDAAKVEDALAPYIGRGPAGPEWSSSYVDVDGKSVLILTVEPPRMGSGIWTFKKEVTTDGEPPIREGAIFVRHQASTEQASSADINMLTRRAAAAGMRLGGLTLVLAPNSAAVPIDIREETLASWLDTEREELRLPPEPPRESELSKLSVVGVGKVVDPAKRKLLTREEILAAAAADIGSGLGAKYMLPDPRSRAKYQAELDSYLTKAGKALPGVLIRSALRREMGRIDLSVRNDTLDNFHAVEVELFIAPPGVLAFFDSGQVSGFRLPTRPVAWGEDRWNPMGGIGAIRLPSYPRSPFVPNISIPRGRIDNSNSSRITLHPVDVRPKRSAELDEFYLLVRPEYAEKTVMAAWTATATDASGSMDGVLEIPVTPRLPTTEELLSDADDDDGDYGDDDD
jgi:hypothetical protein